MTATSCSADPACTSPRDRSASGAHAPRCGAQSHAGSRERLPTPSAPLALDTKNPPPAVGPIGSTTLIAYVRSRPNRCDDATSDVHKRESLSTRTRKIDTAIIVVLSAPDCV